MNNDIINFLKFVQLDSYNIDYENTDVWVPLSPDEETIVHLYLKPDEKERSCPHCGHNHCVIKDRVLKKLPQTAKEGTMPLSLPCSLSLILTSS